MINLEQLKYENCHPLLSRPIPTPYFYSFFNFPDTPSPIPCMELIKIHYSPLKKRVRTMLLLRKVGFESSIGFWDVNNCLADIFYLVT